MLTLYDAARCPYCARARIVLAEKDVPHEIVAVDLDDRPRFIIELNPPSGRVPVIEEASMVLPESPVIMEYLEELYPEPSLLPADAHERARARLAILRFWQLGDPYYDLYLRRPAGTFDRLDEALRALDSRLETARFLAGDSYSLADIAYIPWILRTETRLGIDLEPYEALAAWRDRLLERQSIAAERELVAAL